MPFILGIVLCVMGGLYVYTKNLDEKLQIIQNEYQQKLDNVEARYQVEIDELENMLELKKAESQEVQSYSKYGLIIQPDASIYGRKCACVCVLGMNDSQLEDKINENLRGGFVEWFPDEELNYVKFSGGTIYLSSNEYLSMDLGYVYKENSVMWFNIYQTVNMHTGEVLYLDNILEVDQELCELLLTEGVAKTDSYAYAIDRDYLEIMDVETVMQNLKMCSIPYDESNYKYKPAFYLYHDRIYFVNVFESKRIFYVEIDNLEQKIKTEKW